MVIRKKFSRSQLLEYTANLPSSLMGMEAGVGSHFLGRALREQGHQVRLIPAQFVRPFVKSNKNDYRDAEAIAEAVERENMRFVPIKTEDQLDLQALHRVRDRLVARRTSVINQIRAFLLERGISFRKGPASLRRQMPEILENGDTNPYLRKMFIHGARAAVLRVKREGSNLGKWMSGLETRTTRNVVIVATADKLARISWAVLSSGNDYQPLHRAALLSN